MNPVIFAGDKPGQNTNRNGCRIKISEFFMAIPITNYRRTRCRRSWYPHSARLQLTYKPLPQAGAFGEEVIVNSDTDRAGERDTLPNAVFLITPYPFAVLLQTD